MSFDSLVKRDLLNQRLLFACNDYFLAVLSSLNEI
jgi:hypothetical protein